MFVTLYKTGEVHFCLFGTNGFHVKIKNLSLWACVDVRTSNMKISGPALADYVKLHQKACRTIIFPNSINQIIDFWCCRGLCRCHFLNFLITNRTLDRQMISGTGGMNNHLDKIIYIINNLSDHVDKKGLVHTMPDKFENATLLLRLGLPSTLQRTYPHKKIRENGTFWIRSLEWNNLKTQLFCISVDRELFVSGTFWIRSRHFVMWFIFPKSVMS